VGNQQQDQAQQSIDEGLRRLVATFSFGGAEGLPMKNLYGPDAEGR
jgi:hypothetical protein